MADIGSATVVQGLPELLRAFSRMDKDIATDLTWELQEAADPVRKTTETYLLDDLYNLPQTPYYAGMKIGVSRAAGTVYIVPAWRPRYGKSHHRPTFGESTLKRMERAVHDKQGEVERGLDRWLGRMANEWGE